MKKNVIILTHGWTGSSVFAALFGRAGYWLGSETVQKPDYDTNENADLVAFNRRLLDTLAAGINHEHHFAIEDVHQIERAAEGMDFAPYREFLARCSQNSPWLWKDPRLTWTIRVWAKVLDLERTAFMILTRDDLQAWISANNRRHVQSMRFTREYKHGITSGNVEFLERHGLPYLQASFEDLLLEPEKTLARMNEFYGLELTMDDLRTVYHEPLYRKSRGFKDLVTATLIYLKNYHERDGRGPRRQMSSATSSL